MENGYVKIPIDVYDELKGNESEEENLSFMDAVVSSEQMFDSEANKNLVQIEVSKSAFETYLKNKYYRPRNEYALFGSVETKVEEVRWVD